MRLFAALAAFIAATASAQVRETITVSVVEVPVTVVDSRGDPVRGLTAANFELFDDGKRRDIVSFDMIDFASRGGGAVSPLNPNGRRSFLLLFDLGNSSPNSLTRAQQAARLFVTESVSPRDLLAVATIDVDRGCRLLSSFTTDRELVTAAIEHPTSFRSADPLGVSNQNGAFIAEAEPGMTASPVEVSAAAGGKHASEATQHQVDVSRGMAWVGEGHERQRVERHVDALGELARYLAAMPGRKQIILLSEGLPSKFLVGRDARDSKVEREQNERIIHGDWMTGTYIGDADNDQRFGSTGTQSLLDRMTRYFRRSDVILHAVDLQGARVQNDVYKGAQVNSNAGLAALARPTGGEVFQNVNDVGENFRRLLHQQEAVYILGFRAPAVKPGAFHELRVKVSAPGRLRVSHRAGYTESGPLSATRRTLTNAEIIVNDIPQNDIPIATLVAPLPPTGPRAQLPVIVDIPGRGLLEGVIVDQAEAEIFIYAFDESGTVRDRVYQRLTLDVATLGERLRQDGIRYYSTLSVPPGKYAVRTLVRLMQTDRRGYARTDIEVPQAAGIDVLPPLSLSSQASMLVRGAMHAAAESYPFHLNGEPFVPAARVKIARGTPQRFALFVYHAAAEGVTFDASVIDAAGTPHATTPSLVSKLQGVDVTKIVFEYDAGALQPGAARLDVVVRARELAAERLVSIPLDVRPQ